jgi:hypothetical protein
VIFVASAPVAESLQRSPATSVPPSWWIRPVTLGVGLPKATNLPLAGSVLTHKWLGNLSMLGTNCQPLLFRDSTLTTLHTSRQNHELHRPTTSIYCRTFLASPGILDCLLFLLYQVLRPSYLHSHKFCGMVLTVIVGFAYKRENGLN